MAENQKETMFVNGFANLPTEKTPKSIICSISMDPAKLKELFDTDYFDQYPNAKMIHFQVINSEKSGKTFLAVDHYRAEKDNQKNDPAAFANGAGNVTEKPTPRRRA